MTTQTEALKLALEALKDAARHLHPAPKQNEAITAIKESLAQPEQAPITKLFGTLPIYDEHEFRKGFIAGQRDAFNRLEEQPEQRSVSEHLEPVASDGYVFVAIPVLEKLGIDKAVIATIATTPPQRTAAEGEDTCRAWVGLTDEEIKEAIKSAPQVETDHAGWVGEQRLLWGRAIEAKLKEKNTRNGGCL